MVDERRTSDRGTSPSIVFSREDEAAIRALADELRVPREVIAQAYGRELAPLRERARVMTFLPLVVSRRVRRLQLDARRLAANATT
jgi:uncharacterized protein DUF3562